MAGVFRMKDSNGNWIELPALVGPKGDKGDPGAAGKDGYTPVKGVDYFDGSPGQNGVSVTHSWNGTTLTVTSASGSSSANLKGEKGDKGDTGTVDTSVLNNYLPKSGGAMTGDLTMADGKQYKFTTGAAVRGNTSGQLILSGSTAGGITGGVFLRPNGTSDTTGGVKIVSKAVIPEQTGMSLGASNMAWNTLYLSGNLSDGTNSISVADIVANSGGSGGSGGMQVEQGSYQGTGVYGESNKNTLTFGFEPTMVWIYGGYSGGYTAVLEMPFMKGNNYTLTTAYPWQSSDHFVVNYTLEGNTLSWYCTSSADRQMNTAYSTGTGLKPGIRGQYYYIALG